MSEGTSKVIPVIAEELIVEKRSVDVSGVRVTKTHEEVINDLLRQERVTVEVGEIDVRSDWEKNNKGVWNKFKDSIHYGGDRVQEYSAAEASARMQKRSAA